MLRITLVDQENVEELNEIIAFAESINHKLKKSEWPLYLVRKDGKQLGYFHNVTHNIIHPAMSLDNTPRETYDMIQEVVRRVAAQGNSVAVMVPVGSHFTEEMMLKLGLYSTHHVLYTTEPIT